MEEAHARGWTLAAKHVYCRHSDADIAMARNAFLGAFLASPCTDLLLVDTDVSWHAGEFAQLMSHEADLVAGIYRAKRDDVEKYAVLWPEQKNMQIDAASGLPLLEADGVGCGFMKLTRRGLERVIEKAKPRYFCDPIVPEVKCPWLFEFSWHDDFIDKRYRLSEDYTFCKRWREAGSKVWVDPNLFVDHTGKKTYEGNVIKHLRAEIHRSYP